MTKRQPGFTLIELMIVVAIIGVLAAIAVPKFSNLIRKSQEAAVKGHLGTVRTAFSLYYVDMEGFDPAVANVIKSYLVPKYLEEMPMIAIPGQQGAPSDMSCTVAFLDDHAHLPTNAHVWVYDAGSHRVRVNCTHTDQAGLQWTEY